jgi:multidrug transporter EmrE-like cation transporter
MRWGATRMMAKAVKSVCAVLPRKSDFSTGGARFIINQWYPIGLVLLNSVLSTGAEVLLKIGAIHSPALHLPAPIGFASPIFSYWVIWGIIAYVGSLSLWLVALPRLPLHLAYGLSSTVHLLVPFACWLVLHEVIPIGRLLGMILILAGILMLGFSHE